ncbi:protein translocase subunit SecD [Sinorhizobium alkalisoli]|uniref:Multifunctional fusion protein n=1 Tax=Sinorhizobium alkalisoli TaxID=1752398 RepID=A0A1E3V8B3_9HYPH|nr:protein translocase subunit SecD [Sinorhizobium alkalisoli]MCA1491190.1 protein translocase subunit SecD [Ensifer sp. NBAIM29]MCG5477569.1 protein translocase subunit SecD [Sinorhizobium alkalisoli]ODR89848.1 protein translocase subunit SecDF [Sinorhizobium alkalisoli]QFI65051.1 Protein-export membrane protein SecD [Sinorhizobium alkalisoli]
MRTSRWAILAYVAIAIFGCLAALPSMLPPAMRQQFTSVLPFEPVTLGLDLKGGSHLVLEVDGAGLQKARLNTLLDDTRRALRGERVSASSARISGNMVTVSIPDPADRERVLPKLQELATPVSVIGFGGSAPEVEVTTAGDVVTLSLTEAGLADRMTKAVEQSLEIIRNRVDQVGVAEPLIQRIGSNRILVQLPGLQDPTRLRELLGSTAQMSFHMLDQTVDVTQPPPRGVEILPGANDGNRYPIESRVAISGERLADAKVGFDQRTNQPVVDFSFDSLGARQFAEITRENVGRPFAVVLDGKVLTAPVINEPILGGRGQISGNFTAEEATVLSALLRSGALPAPLTIIEERSVGPNLGSDSIRMGLYTGLVGFALVIALMVVLYGAWGMIANVGLLLHTIMTIGVLALIGSTLTLPGIAGIILGIGMAVDANILINARIREETENGAGAMKALDLGFNKAYATIIDANITTLTGTILLFWLGSGPVRGFAVTMMLGIAISMFTSVTIVRLLMREVVIRRKMKKLEIPSLFGRVPKLPTISFMKRRFQAIGLSAFLSISSVILFFTPGLNYGIDFIGGIQVEAVSKEKVDLSRLRSSLSSLELGEVALQDFGNGQSVLIRVQRQPGGENEQTAALNRIKDAVTNAVPDATLERTEVVGPTISTELARSGSLAVGLAMLAILLYIWFRFEWHFAVGAIAVLLLDITKTIGFFALTGVDFNLTAIAALLTMIGYSVNDKVVVYDRMRENLRKFKSMPFSELIDMSINQVIARCIFTSVATALSLVPMAIWGGEVVRSFAWPMIFGVIIATSSSIYIGGPILLFLSRWWKDREVRRSGAQEAGTPTA